MATFQSEIRELGTVKFPAYQGSRIMMMPFRVDDLRSFPGVVNGLRTDGWRPVLRAVLDSLDETPTGVGYVTIDEGRVQAGRTQRRPGLHVDGVGPDGRHGSWGGGWGGRGMVLAASETGSRGWAQEFEGVPGNNGDCEHLRDQLDTNNEIVFVGGKAFWCGSLAVHEALPLKSEIDRQFFRLSLPNTAPWYEGYTENPLGVAPAGPIMPARTEFMAYSSVA